MACDEAVDWAGAHLEGADLRGRDLGGAQLQYANFRGADLRGANFAGADARGAIFDGADCRAADFSMALLQGAGFRGARLQKTCFEQAWLLSAHLEHAEVAETIFTSANLEWAWVDGVDFGGAEVWCTVFLNVRGLSGPARQMLEANGGLTGPRSMILGRELYESADES
jgi:uncharacterized protein YjbI with pentapeptide repeats